MRKMFEMASKLKDPVDLSLGAPDFDVPDVVKKAAISAILAGRNRYVPTVGIPELRTKVAEKLKKKNNILVDDSCLIITSAVSGGLSIVLTTILNNGDEVILFDPYFVGYKQLILQNGGIPVYAKTKEDFSPDILDFESKITKRTKAVIINSPNNPTGKIYSAADLKNIASIAEKNGLLVISDEIYEDFCFEKTHFSIGSVYENTVTLNGFSKSCGMPGWRVGYVCAPKRIIDECVKVQQYNFVCAPSPFQYAALKALDFDTSSITQEYKRKRNIIYEGLGKKYSFSKPEGAFYAFIKYPYDGKKFIQDCVEKNLLVVPASVFSQHDTHFRISFATSENVLKKAVAILNTLIS